MKFRFFFAFIIFVLGAGCSSKKGPPTIDQMVIDEKTFAPFPGETCIAPENTKIQIIFFHGMDTTTPSSQFLSQVKMLRDLSVSHSAKIYIPRATEKCPGYTDQLCWGWGFDRKETLKAVGDVLAKSKSCLTRQVPVVLLGFSNGGNLLTKWYTLEKKPESPFNFDRVIASGSGLSLTLGKKAYRSPLPFIFLAGNLDNFNYPRTKKLFSQFRARYANVRFIDFNGDHNLDKSSLLKALE